MTKSILLNILCLIYYITSSIYFIPCIYRMWKRKSSEDYSLVAESLNIIGTTAWTLYIYMSVQTITVYIGTAFDAIITMTYIFLAFKYHKPNSNNKERYED